MKCVNSQGNCASNDKTCPKWEDSVKIMYAQAAAATKPVVKTVNVETQTEMTWPEGTKQPKKCAVEKQIAKVNKTSASSQTSASQNDPIKLKISQSKEYFTKQHKGSYDPVHFTTNMILLSSTSVDLWMSKF